MGKADFEGRIQNFAFRQGPASESIVRSEARQCINIKFSVPASLLVSQSLRM